MNRKAYNRHLSNALDSLVFFLTQLYALNLLSVCFAAFKRVSKRFALSEKGPSAVLLHGKTRSILESSRTGLFLFEHTLTSLFSVHEWRAL